MSLQLTSMSSGSAMNNICEDRNKKCPHASNKTELNFVINSLNFRFQLSIFSNSELPIHLEYYNPEILRKVRGFEDAEYQAP